MKKIYLAMLAVLLGVCASSFAQTTAFTYTGTVQYFTVPSGVTTIGVIARGATGGYNSTMWSTLCSSTLPDSPGRGACVSATLAVTPGQVLNIYVGGKGTDGINTACAATPGVGGWNGGGAGGFGYGSYAGGGGGGASDVRLGGVALTDRVIVAAGGGGAGGNYYTIVNAERGGHGGTLTGEDGYGNSTPLMFGGAAGGTPTAGGAGAVFGAPWASGSNGGLGFGGNAGTGVAFSGSGGGGGGSGYYGGGGGSWGGGGGGSSYTNPLITTAVSHTRGCNALGDGSVDICLTDPGLISGTKPTCAGLTCPLFETIGGGTWSSSDVTIATIGSSSGIVTAVKGGTATITYTVSSACATVYTTKLFFVTPAPLPIAGPNPVCVGTSVPFTDATTPGYWSISGTSSATIGTASGIVTGITPGTAIVTYTETKAGCYTTMPININGITGVTRVCDRLSVPLGFMTGSGAWSSSDTMIAKVDASGIVTGTGIGTATISYSNAICPSTITMSVNPNAPNLGVTDICVKGTGYVTNVVGGGTWSSSNLAVAIAASTTGLVTGVTAGTTTISYLLPSGCLSQSKVTVTDAPPAITGFAEVCPDKTTTLANIIGGGTWSSLNPGVATVGAGSGLVKGLVSDTTSILYTIFPGCSAYRTVTVNPIPLPITGSDTLCPGVTDTLFTKSIGGLWSTSTPNLDTIVDSNGIITTRMAGTAVVTYTMPTGCSRSRNVYIYPVPTPKVTYNAFTKTFYTDLGYPAYQWYDSISGKIPKAVSPSLAATYSQWYFVVITDTNGCKLKSDTLRHDIRVAGVGNVGGVAVRIYPNPVSGKLFIESPIAVRAIISTVDGKQVMEQRNAKEMDLSMLASAPYFISLYDESGQLVSVQKIIKE